LLNKYQHLCVGQVGTAATAAPKAKSAAAPSASSSGRNAIFGSTIPYAEPMWAQTFATPFYNDSHRRLRAAVREFCEREMFPFQQEWDENKNVPRELLKKAGDEGILAGVSGAYPWPEKYAGSKVAGGVDPKEFNAFHELVILDELSRAYAGPAAALAEGINIGIAPLMYFGSEALKNKVVGPCLRGEKTICLAITEPAAGSDVANIKTTARKTPDGKHYIVNGEKKWVSVIAQACVTTKLIHFFVCLFVALI